MQKINILGLTLTDRALKESLVLADEYIQNGALNTILYITAPMLILAEKDAQEKELIEAVDMTLCGDADIIRVAKIESKSRLYEVENQIFIKEFLKRMVRGERKIYLLADSKEEIDKLRKKLEELQRGLSICGSSIIGEETEDIGAVINTINDIAPTVIISQAVLGKQERWMADAKPFLNVEVWLGIPRDMKLSESNENLRKKVLNKVYKTMFRRSMNKYSEENDKSE